MVLRVIGVLILAAIAFRVVRRLLADRSPAAMAPGGSCRAVFRSGRLVELDGLLPAPARAALEHVARDTDLTGEVHVGPAGRLTFSSRIDPAVRQRLRNALLSAA